MNRQEEEKKGQKPLYEQRPVSIDMFDEKRSGFEEGSLGVPLELDATPGAAPKETPAPEPAGKQSRFRTVDDILEYMKDKPESDEHRKRRERLERSQGVVNGIADLGRALANLYYTTQYAPNAYDPSASLTEKQRERMERARKERERERDWHLNYALKMKAVGDADRNFDFAKEKDKAQQDYQNKSLAQREQAEQRRQDELELKYRQQEWREQFEQGKLDIAQLNADIRKMAEHNKQSRASINHNLASWRRSKRIITDKYGKKVGEVEERIVANPKTGEFEIKESTVWDDSYVQGGQQEAKQGTAPTSQSTSIDRTGWTKGYSGIDLY